MLEKLTPQVYYMPHYSETDRPTLGLICGDRYSLVVDAGNSPAHASDFLRLVNSMDVPSIVGVVITHWHWDHIFGIQTMGLLTISHEETKQKIAYMKTLKWDDASLDNRVENGEEIEFCSEMIKREMPERDYLELTVPDVTFDHQIEIDLGGVTCIVEHVGGVHAQDSSIIYVPEERVLFLGDCVYQDFYSGEWSYDKDEFEKLLTKIKKYDAEWYVTGHQAPKKYDEMWQIFNEISTIGEIVGEEDSVRNAIDRFSEMKLTAPNQDQLEFIENFVNGNVKKKSHSEI